jgi:hypothetical protein
MSLLPNINSGRSTKRFDQDPLTITLADKEMLVFEAIGVTVLEQHRTKYNIANAIY